MAIAVANRYARALADVVGRTGEYREILRELDGFLALHRESAELREVLQTPAVALEEKVKLLEVILGRLAASPVTMNFLRVVASNYRTNLLEQIIEAFRKIANERLGIVQVRVVSATELSESERRAVCARFAEMTQKQVDLAFHLEPGLLGGIVAQIESTVYDGSVRGHLERIRQRLMAR